MTDIKYYNKIRAQAHLLNKYMKNKKNRVGTAARRDWNRLIQDLPLCYSHIHQIGVYVPESEYQPDLLRDVPFVEDVIPYGRRREVYSGRDHPEVKS